MRSIFKIICHHAGDILTMEQVIRMHTQERGWSDIGYHTYIERDSSVRLARPLHIQGAHDFGENFGSIGICMSGDFRGVPVAEFLAHSSHSFGVYVAEYKQFWTLIRVIKDYMRQFPNIHIEDVYGHQENEPVSTPTECPGFSPQLIRQALRDTT